jgi:hypothetical protein
LNAGTNEEKEEDKFGEDLLSVSDISLDENVEKEIENLSQLKTCDSFLLELLSMLQARIHYRTSV